MDKLLKIKDSLNNPLNYDTGLGIFDLKSYKKAIDQTSFVSIEEYIPPKYKKQPSFA